MNYLGIDYGKKRIGLAWVQSGLDVVLPYGIIKGGIDELAEFVKKEKIDKLVMGMPTGLDGNENQNTKRVRTFAENLEYKTGLKVDFVDERYTSAEADHMGGEVSRDEKAAMIILRNYVDSL
jgi:putative Holliday junction resolvase